MFRQTCSRLLDSRSIWNPDSVLAHSAVVTAERNGAVN
jgi:hypothetical protein